MGGKAPEPKETIASWKSHEARGKIEGNKRTQGIREMESESREKGIQPREGDSEGHF